MKKRFLLTSVLMLLLTVLALSTSTYAWFSMSSEVEVDEFNVTAVQTTGGLSISTDGRTWDKNATVSTANPAYDLTATADGNIYKQSGDYLVEAEASKYNTFYIYLKTDGYGRILLDLNESYIVPNAYASYVKSNNSFVDSKTFVTNALDYEATLDSANIQNKSTSGDFSRDWIASAFRMSLQVVGFQSAKSANYTAATDTLPNGYTAAIGFVKSLDEVNISKHSITGKYSLSNEGEEETLQGLAVAYDENSQAIADTYVLSDSASMATYSAKDFLTNDYVELCEISNVTGDLQFTTGNTYIVKVKVNVWIEGQDNEAILPLTGGIVTSALKFKLDTSETSDPTDYRTNVAFTGSGSTDGLTFTSPSAALTGGIKIYKNVTVNNDTEALPTTGLVNSIDLAADSSSYTDGTFVVGETYTLIAPFTYSSSTQGNKADNYFTVDTQTYVYYTITITQ